ncbi:Histidine phosphatase superfamily clade-2, partial [Trinorchestia longiramus]
SGGQLFRHGARTPVKLYLYDPNSNPSLWPTGLGQLTQEGLNQCYQLGKWLRRRYGRLLSSSWRHTELTVTSSSVERSLNSASATVAGLYSDPLLQNPSQRFNSEMPWAPAPVKTTPSKLDQVIDLKRSCKRVEQINREINATTTVQQYLASLRPLRNALAAQLHQTFDSLEELGVLYDTFKIQQENNLTLMDAVQLLMPQLAQVQKHSLRLLASTPEQKILRAGPLIIEIIQNMIMKEDAEESRANVSLFSVHDSNIVEQLLVLRSYNNRAPPYASALIFELHQKPFSKKHLVQV